MSTSIEWAQEVWNPTVGCSRVSPGCDNCYAMKFAHRGVMDEHKGLTVMTDHGVDWNGTVRTLSARLNVPLDRKAPTRWFVDSMSDLWHPEVPWSFIARVFLVMAVTQRHTYMVLTKRGQAMRDALSNTLFTRMLGQARIPDDVAVGQLDLLPGEAESWLPLPNLWLGVSVESNKWLFRVDQLRQTPAAVRFLSLEPLIGPLPSLDLEGIGLVIVGGESGPGARPMDPDWARDIRDRCATAGVPFFFKQTGSVLARSLQMSDTKGHKLDEIPEDLRIRELPA